MSDRASYFKFLFDKAKNIEGVVQGMDAVKFFQKSGLPMVSSCLRLGDSEGYLEFIELQKDEFELALRFITLAQRGFQANQISLQMNQDETTLPKFEGFQLPKPSPPPLPPAPSSASGNSLMSDPFAELMTPISSFNEAKPHLPSASNFVQTSKLSFLISSIPQPGVSSPFPQQQQKSPSQSTGPLGATNLLDLDIGFPQNQVSQNQIAKPQESILLQGSDLPAANKLQPPMEQPPSKAEPKTLKTEPQEEDDFDDFQAAQDQQEPKTANLVDQEEEPQKPVQKKQSEDKFQSFFSSNLINFTTKPEQPDCNQPQTNEPAELEEQGKIELQGMQQTKLTPSAKEVKNKQSGGASRLSLLDAAFAELDFNLGQNQKQVPEQTEEVAEEAATKQEGQNGEDFDDFQEAQDNDPTPEGSPPDVENKEKKNLILMPIDLDFSVDSPASFVNQLSEKTDTEVSKIEEVPPNLAIENSPTQLRVQLEDLGISLSDSQSEQAKNEAKKHLVLSKPMVLSDNSEIGPSSVSQDSDCTDKDKSAGGWAAFGEGASEKKESNNVQQPKSWFASMKKEAVDDEAESVQSQLNKVFPALEGINTLPQLEQKQKAEEGEDEPTIELEEDFGDFEDAKSQEEASEDASPKIFEMDEQIVVNRPNEGEPKELSFIPKIEFDEKKLLSNFMEEFKEDQPRKSTVRTLEQEESPAGEPFTEEVLFSARPSITHRQSENCFNNFKPTPLPKEISKLALTNQDEMGVLAKFLFEKGLFKEQLQIERESKYQKELVELNSEKRKAMEADELELAIEYREKIKQKQAQMHGQEYLQEIEETIVNLSNSERDQQYWIWNEFRDLMEECIKLKRQSKDDYSEKYIESLKVYQGQLKEVIEARNEEGYEALLLEMKNKYNILKSVKRVTLEVIAQKCSLVCEGLNEESAKLKERIAGLVQILAEIDSQSLQEQTLRDFLHSPQFSTFYQGVHSLIRIRSNLYSSLSEINAYIESSVSIEIEGTLQQVGNLERDFDEINLLLDQLAQESETAMRGQNGSRSEKFNFIECLSQRLSAADSNAQYEFKQFLKTLIEI